MAYFTMYFFGIICLLLSFPSTKIQSKPKHNQNWRRIDLENDEKHQQIPSKVVTNLLGFKCLLFVCCGRIVYMNQTNARYYHIWHLCIKNTVHSNECVQQWKSSNGNGSDFHCRECNESESNTLEQQKITNKNMPGTWVQPKRKPLDCSCIDSAYTGNGNGNGIRRYFRFSSFFKFFF